MANGYDPGEYLKEFLTRLPQIYTAKKNFDLQKKGLSIIKIKTPKP